MFELGEFLRNRYDSFLGENFKLDVSRRLIPVNSIEDLSFSSEATGFNKL